MKPSDFEFSCESFWSTRINECMRMCPWIRIHSYRMRIRNMRNIEKKTNTALLISYYVAERLEARDLCDSSGGLLSHNAPACSRQLQTAYDFVQSQKYSQATIKLGSVFLIHC